MNLSLKETAAVTAASIVFIAAATASAPKSVLAPENAYKAPSTPVCIKTANTYICKTAP